MLAANAYLHLYLSENRNTPANSIAATAILSKKAILKYRAGDIGLGTYELSPLTKLWKTRFFISIPTNDIIKRTAFLRDIPEFPEAFPRLCFPAPSLSNNIWILLFFMVRSYSAGISPAFLPLYVFLRFLSFLSFLRVLGWWLLSGISRIDFSTKSL